MKKFLATLLFAGAIAMTACAPDIKTAAASESKLKSNGYTVEVYSDTEAKASITGLDYEGFTLVNALFADKGTRDNKDFLLAFYFNTVDEASNFVTKNIAQFNRYLEKNLGSNLTAKQGSHNNVAYAGSETSFNSAF